MRGFILLKNGHAVAREFWPPYHPQDKFWIYSGSKTFTATSIGLAAEEGLLALDDKVISFFPEKLPEQPSEHLRCMEVRHLLTMSSGHDADTVMALFEDPQGDWVRAFLRLPVAHRPGSHFLYNSGATYMLSAILQKVSGVTLLEYLTPRLFQPLGFGPVAWDSDTRGICTGGWGLQVRLEDLAKLGQLYLDNGMYKGKRLLSQQWVEQASAPQADNSKVPNAGIEGRQGYGYQIWMCRHGAYRVDGAFGQFCFVLPKQSAVLALSCETDDMQQVMDVVWEYLLPALEAPPIPQEKALTKAEWRLEANPWGLTQMRLSFGENALELKFSSSSAQHILKAGRGSWLPGETTLPLGNTALLPLVSMAAQPKPVYACFHWTGASTLEIEYVYREMPHRERLVLTFDDAGVTAGLPPNKAAKAMGKPYALLYGYSAFQQ